MQTFARHRLSYVLVSILFALVRCQSQSSCTAWSNSEFGSNFYQTPQPAQSGQSFSCSLYTDSHCCTPSYDSVIANGTDLLTQQIAMKLDLANHQYCAAAINHLACAQCAPDQGVWLEQLTPQKFHLRLCDKMCEFLYSSCLQTPVITQNFTEVGTLFQTATDFCYSILNSLSWSVSVVPQTQDRQCFNPFVPKCTSASINHFYTDCLNEKRDLYFYWDASTTCAGGIKLPNPILNLTCPISCSTGYYLPLGSTTCEQCPPGTTASTSRCIGQWDQWPSDITIRNYCTQSPFYEDYPIPPNCVAWTLRGDRIETKIQGLQGISAVLQIIIKTVQPGYLKWIGSVDAEPFYDRFSLYIDSQLAVRLNNSLIAQTFTHPLSAGDHSLEWIYSKDGSWDFGSDSAKIILIEINGVKYNVEQCVDIRSDPCTCFRNNSCDLRLPCTTNDYESYYTPCVNGLTRLAYRWKEPMVCNNATGVSLPPPSEPILCQQVRCPLGSWALNASGGVCTPCPPGYYGTLDNPLGCSLCPEGKYSTISGATFCRTCGVGTYSNQNRTDCETTCSFVVSSRFGLNGTSTFNLQSFPSQMDWYDTTGTKQYRVSLCKKQAYCYFDDFNQRVCEPPAFVFEIDNQHIAPRRIGEQLNFIDGTSDTDFWLEYQNDGEVPFNCSRQKSTFLVHFVCGLKTFTPKVTQLRSNGSCLIAFEVETHEACRSCLDSDYYPQLGECVDGYQTRTFVTASNCTDTKYKLLTERIPCSSITIQRSYLNVAGILAIIALILVVVLAVVALVFYRKKKEFEIKYMKLVNDKDQGDNALEMGTR